MHDGGFQTIGQRENLIMRALTSRAAQHGYAAIAVEECGETRDIGVRRYQDRATEQQTFSCRFRRSGSGLKRHVAWSPRLPIACRMAISSVRGI